MRKKFSNAWLLAFGLMSGIAAIQGCGSDDNAQNTTSGEPALPLPAELNFQSIEQEFQQQGQQVGQFCPKKFKAIVSQSGDMTIQNQQGQTIIKGKMSQQDFAQIANTANEVVNQGTDQQVDCKAASDGNQQGTSQLFVTSTQQQTDMVASKKDDQVCDFAKSKKGEQLQQQMTKVVQQGCNKQLPPTEEPTPTPTPSPTGTPSPTPTPTLTIFPGPTSTPTPTPTPTSTTTTGGIDEDQNPACDSALAKLNTDIQAARQCATDTDCNYINGTRVVDRSSVDTFITVFECGDATPVIVAANGAYVTANRSMLASDISAARSQCGLSTFISSCQARGGFLSATPPSCVSNVCQAARP